MKIAIIVTARVTAETFVQGFAKFAASKGHEVTVIADSVKPYCSKIGDGTLEFKPIKMFRDPSPKNDLRSLIALTRALRRVAPDAVLYATPKASLLGSIAATINRVPTRIYQLWGLRLETVRGPSRFMLGALEFLTSSLSSVVLANSQSLAKRYKDLRLNGLTKIDVIAEGSSHGVNLTYFAPLTRDDQGVDKEKETLTLGFVGRLHPDKGIDTLINALGILLNRGRSISAIIVGNDEGFSHPIPMELKPIIGFVGFAGDTRIHYRNMDVLVLPSLREGFPNVVLEAAAMGIPAIVSDGTGVIDSVIDGKTGYVVPVSDAQALADKVENFIDSPNLILKFGNEARKRVEKSFGQEYVWDKTLTYLINRVAR